MKYTISIGCFCGRFKTALSDRYTYLLLLFFIICDLFSVNLNAQTVQSFTTPGANTFHVPAGVTQFSVQCWGGGGSGGGAKGNPSAGGGGAGGSYAKKSYNVISVDSFRLHVGQGGTGSTSNGTAGSLSWFQDSTVVKALGGRGGAEAVVNNESANGGGAYISGNIGDTVYYGGGGANGSVAAYGGGGGGSSAGTLTNGNTPSGLNGGTAVSGGSAGANGASASAAGNAASAYGGGGGGGRAQNNTDRSGGAGANGLVKINYTCPVYAIDSISISRICSDTGALVNIFANAATLPAGRYVVTYNVGAPNAMIGITTSMTVSQAGYGSFRTALLSSQGNTSITIVSLSSGGSNGCTTTLISNNTATFMVMVSPNPYVEFVASSADTVSVIQVCSYNGAGSQNDMQIMSGNPGGSAQLQWQISYDGGSTWSDAPGPSSLTSLYMLDPLYTNFESNPGTYYFRVVITNSQCTGISNKIRLTVSGNTDVTPGAIGSHQYFCVTGDPAPILNLTSPTGSNNNLNYKWQLSTDSVNFSNINGADANTYDPPVLSQTTYFRRVIFSGGCRKFSNVVRVKVSVASPPSPSSISGAGLLCANSNDIMYVAQQSVDADTYIWTVPSGWSISSGQNNDSVIVNSGNSGGSIGVMASNACGSSAYNYLPVALTSGSTAANIVAGSRICLGDSTVISIQINGGAPPYQVEYMAGADTMTLYNYISGTAIRVLPLGTTTYRLLDVINYGGCNGQGLAVGTTIQPAGAATWVGNTDSLWENANNWCGGVPSPADSIVIPYGTRYSPVIKNQAITVRHLYLDSAAILKINGQWLNLTGSIYGTGKLNIEDGMLELSGTSMPQTINGSLLLNKKIKKLRLSNSQGVSIAAAGDSVCITEMLDFGNSNVWFQTNDKLVMMARATKTASVGDMTSGGIYTGNRITGSVTVEKYFPLQSKAWWFLSSPTVGQTIKQSWQEGNAVLGNTRPGFGTIFTSNVSGATGAAGFDIYTANGTTLKTYNSTTGSWDGLSSTHTPLANNKGYMIFVRGDRSVTAYNQAPTATILRTSGQLYTPLDNPPAPVNVSAGKFEAVGNPYASAIDFKRVQKTGGVQEIYYVWDPKLTNSNTSAYGLGGYQTFVKDGVDFDVIPGGGSFNSGNKIIGAGQAFFIRSVGQSGQIVFTENCKVDLSMASRQAETTNIVSNSPKIKTRLSVMVSGAPVLLDGVNSQFDNSFSVAIDSLDAQKIGNSTSETIAIQHGGIALTVERTSLPTPQDTVYYAMGQMKRMSYQLSLQAENWHAGMLQPVLFDHYMNVTIPISADTPTIHAFVVNTDPSSWSSNRFRVAFRQYVVLPVKINKLMAQRKSVSKATLTWEAEVVGDSYQFLVEKSMNGIDFAVISRLIPDQRRSYHYIDAQLSEKDAYYRIKVIGEGEIIYSNIAHVNSIDGSNFMEIVPNPVTDGRCAVKIHMSEGCIVDLQLMDMTGKKVFGKRMMLAEGINNFELNFPNVSTGIYKLRAMINGRQHHVKNIFFQGGK